MASLRYSHIPFPPKAVELFPFVFQLLLIRHAQSANNALPESQRVPDPGLTKLGQQQAERLSDWLTCYRPTQLLCSGFRRALETTKPMAQKLNLRPSVRSDLFEQGGCYSGYQANQISAAPGMGRSEILQDFGDWEVDHHISEHGWYHGRDLETDEQSIERAQLVAGWVKDELLAKSLDSSELNRPALVIHADFKALLLNAILQTRTPSSLLFSNNAYFLAEVWNASVTQLSWVGNRWRLDFWNSIGHLPVEQLTH